MEYGYGLGGFWGFGMIACWILVMAGVVLLVHLSVNEPLLDHQPADHDRVVKVHRYGVFGGVLAAGCKMRDPETRCVTWRRRG